MTDDDEPELGNPTTSNPTPNRTLVKRNGGGPTTCPTSSWKVSEVEAYRQNDSASHGGFGITPRTTPIFGPGGHAYFYLCYRLHTMLNIVADKEGVGPGVLIRSCAPICDEHRLRNHPAATGTEDFETCPIIRPRKGVLELLDRPEPDEVSTGPLVGINFALHENLNALWQFAIAGSPWISAPKNTLQAA